MIRHLISCDNSNGIIQFSKCAYTLFCIACLLIIPQFLQSQSIQRQVIGIAGGNSTIEGKRIHFTVGETFVGHFKSESNTRAATVGFQQGSPSISAISKAGALNISLAPNPVTTLLNIEILDPLPSFLNLEMIDQYGRVILKNQNLQNRTHQVNMQRYPVGLYYLRITDELGTIIQTEKLVKSQ